ncbi:MAG: DUF211 domain-containing protein [Halobacteriaceae archaeon]
MPGINRLVLDLLKPNEIDTVDFAQSIAEIDGVEGVNAALLETDKQVQNLKLTIEGEDIDYDAVEQTITDLSGTIHSIDEIAYGERLVEESRTPQDD